MNMHTIIESVTPIVTPCDERREQLLISTISRIIRP